MYGLENVDWSGLFSNPAVVGGIVGGIVGGLYAAMMASRDARRANRKDLDRALKKTQSSRRKREHAREVFEWLDRGDDERDKPPPVYEPES